jgi:hypothetical protein
MEANINAPGVQFEEQPGVPNLGAVPVAGRMWWKLALATILLAIVLVLAASALSYSQQEDTPMQVEPMAIMA